MIGVVVVTHGQLATELVNAAEMIVGDLPQFTAVSIGWHDDVNDAREEIAQAVERVRGEEGVLLLIEPEPGLLVETTDQALELMGHFTSPFVGLNYDIGHAYCVGDDPATTIARRPSGWSSAYSIASMPPHDWPTTTGRR